MPGRAVSYPPARDDQIEQSEQSHHIHHIVFDSNVLISLLVFDDPRYRATMAAWRAGAIRVITDAACAAEFQRVLAYPRLKLEPDRQLSIFSNFELLVSLHLGAEAPTTTLPVCADADDQKFLQLAANCGADYLVTGDKELLRLARRVSFAIVTMDQLERQLNN